MLRKSNMKIIHWEYNENLIGQENNAKPEMRIGLTHDSETDKPTGVYFNWKYLLQKGNQVCLHSVCQDSYRTVDTPNLTLSELKILLYNSIQNFKEIFQERLDLLNLTVATPAYPIDDNELKKVLNALNQ